MSRRRLANDKWQPKPGHESCRTEGAGGSSGTHSTGNPARVSCETRTPTTSCDPIRAELAEQGGYGAAVQQQAQQLRPAACVTLEIGEPGSAVVGANNPIQESVGPPIATKPNRMAHYGPTTEADEVSTPAGAELRFDDQRVRKFWHLQAMSINGSLFPQHHRDE